MFIKSIIILLLVTSPLHAAWRNMFETKNSMYYVNPKHIDKKSKTIVINILSEPAKNEKKGSRIITTEINCNLSLYRNISLLTFSNFRAKGNLINTYEFEDHWKKISKGTNISKLKSFLCNY
jgi:hypothetical protein